MTLKPKPTRTFSLLLLGFIFSFTTSKVGLAQQGDISLETIAAAQADGKPEQALQLCEQSLAANPWQPKVYALQAGLLRQLDRVAEIPVALEPAINKYPRDRDLLFRRALAWKSMGEIVKLTQDARRLVDLGDGLGYSLLAQVCEAEEDALGGIRAYTRLLETYPNDSEEIPDWRYSRADLLAKLCVFDWAEADVFASFDADPAPFKLLLLGEIYARTERWDEAEKVLQRFNAMTDDLEFVGEVRRMSALLGMFETEKVAFLLKQYKDTYQDPDKLKLADDVAKELIRQQTLREETVKAAREQGRPSGFETAEEIEAKTERLAELKSTSDSAELTEFKELGLELALLGMAMADSEFVESILESLRDAGEKMSFSGRETTVRLTAEAWLMYQKDSKEAALGLINRATTNPTSFGEAYRVKSQVLFALKRLPEALDAARQAVALDSMNSDALCCLAIIANQAGNTQEAAQALTKLGQLDPTNHWGLTITQAFASSIGADQLAIRCQGRRLKGDYQSELLVRARLFHSANLPQLAVADAYEFLDLEEDGSPNEALDIIALAGADWFWASVQFEEGGPSSGEVIEACLKAEAAMPDEAIYPFSRSRVLRWQGKTEDALQAARRAVELSPNNVKIQAHFIDMLLETGEIAEASTANQQLQKVAMDSPRWKRLRERTDSKIELAESLLAHLQNVNLASNTATAAGKMLAMPQGTAKLFEPEFAMRVDELYKIVRPQLGQLRQPKPDAIPGFTFFHSDSVQSPSSSEFHAGLADVAELLRGDHYFVDVLYQDPETGGGTQFGSFVRIDDQWHLFLKPWKAK